jgi:hypothetical protein
LEVRCIDPEAGNNRGIKVLLGYQTVFYKSWSLPMPSGENGTNAPGTPENLFVGWKAPGPASVFAGDRRFYIFGNE